MPIYFVNKLFGIKQVIGKCMTVEHLRKNPHTNIENHDGRIIAAHKRIKKTKHVLAHSRSCGQNNAI